MIVHLRDLNRELVDHWARAFAGAPGVRVSHGQIFDAGEHMDAEAIVSPANSFGFMDGGIDFVYSEFFGWAVSEELQRIIAQEFYGEVPVGQAVAFDFMPWIRGTRFPVPCSIHWLISAPTMRVPENVANTVNAYLAFRAALLAARRVGAKSILCPGLGTAVGRMSPETCARQMIQAYHDFLQPRKFPSWMEAQRRHVSMLERK